MSSRGAGSISGDRRTSAGSIRAPVVDHVIHTPSGLPPTIEKDEEFENAANEGINIPKTNFLIEFAVEYYFVSLIYSGN